MNNTSFPGFEECIKLISSNDPMTFEDGFHLLLPRVKEYGDKIVVLIKRETNLEIKSKLVELLGYCEDEKYIPIFMELLQCNNHEVVSWSLTSLEKLKSGKEIAYKFRTDNPKWLE